MQKEDAAPIGSGPGGSQYQLISSPAALKGKKGSFIVNDEASAWKGARPKYRHLLDDVEVKRWYDNVSRGSRITADIYLRRLGAVCSASGLSGPKDLLAIAERGGRRSAYDFLMDLVSRMEGEQKAGSYIHSNVKAVRSWLSHNGMDIDRRVKIRGVDETPTLRSKHAPTPAELSLFFSEAPPQTRCAAVLIAHAGLRIEVVGNYGGSDGLRVGDVPEMSIDHGLVRFDKIPPILVVRPNLSKAGHQYFTFLTREGCGYIAQYPTQRMRSGERIGESSPLVMPGQHWRRKNPFVRAGLVGALVRKRLRQCRINARPHDLRSSFDTGLMLAESKGLMIRDYRVFFMGHKGDVEHRYTVNRHSLPTEVVEDMRSCFARAQGYLQGEGPVSQEQDIHSEMRKQLLLASGFKEEELSRVDIRTMSNEELHEAMKRKFLGEMASNGPRQKVIPVAEVRSHIEQGYEYVATLPNGEAIVRVPS